MKYSDLLTNRKFVLSATAMAALGLGGSLWWHIQSRHVVPAHMAYTASGYGGFVPVPASPKAVLLPSGPSALVKNQPPPEQIAQAAYAAGHYPEVETAAAQVIRQAVRQPTLPHRKAAAHAGSLLAYAAARRHDLKLARIRFAAAQKAAAALPDKGKQPVLLGQPDQATLEEDDAFQHAVCTGALGDKPAAEAEYVAFMRRFPDSPLVQASVKRIALLHGGDIPPADEAVWREAMQIALAHQKAQMREVSLCGPECLAELLRRQGRHADVPTLAQEMHTSDQGTSLASLAAAATSHGFTAEGLALTQKGLTEQRLPVIALIEPGHYVLVEKADVAGVTVWDPDAEGPGRSAERTLPLAVWQQCWRGITLALTPMPGTDGKPAFVQTARR